MQWVGMYFARLVPCASALGLNASSAHSHIEAKALIKMGKALHGTGATSPFSPCPTNVCICSWGKHWYGIALFPGSDPLF